MKNLLLLIIFACFTITSCKFFKKKDTSSDLIAEPVAPKPPFRPGSDTLPPLHFNPDSLMHVDLNQDLSNKTLAELRNLRSLVYARHGQLFHESYLREYFGGKYSWYDSITTLIWMRVGDKIEEEPQLPEEEKDFIAKIDKLIEDKKQVNYSGDNEKSKILSSNNIVNLVKFKNVNPDFLKKLEQNHFVVFEENVPQLFNIYENNDYEKVPSFITSDLYLQLFHMYFSYVMRTVEKEKLMANLEQMTLGLYNNSKQIASKTTNQELKKIAEYNEVFYAIPYELLTSKKLAVPNEYASMYKTEVSNCLNASGDEGGSRFLDISYFPYSLFKPRGYYTREDSLKQYFKAVMWIQTACFCRETSEQLKKAVFASFILNKEKDSKGNNLIDGYNAFYNTISFFIGQPDDLSFLDIISIIKKRGIKDINKLVDENTIQSISNDLSEIVKSKNRIVPKIKLTCPEKINFMPRRYVFDNEILLNLADTIINAKRDFPRGLDVFSAIGNKTADDILINFYKDDKKWDKYISNMDKMKKMMSKFEDWDVSVYNKWFDCLKSLTEEGKSKVVLLNTESWNKKSLNTALASWAELKHDAILYAKQPSMAEYGGGGMPTPPPDVTKGYIEPNIPFWEKMIEVIDLTNEVLDKFHYNSEKIKRYTDNLKSDIDFALSVSKKENNHESLTDEEYGQIERIGGSIDRMTLQIVLENADSWEEVTSPDKSVSVIADVFLRNVPECPKNGVLYEAVGKVNSIYVVAEIDGYLYLTKGAVLSYHEFAKAETDRLTDEDWQKIITTSKVPPIPEWYKEFSLQSKFKPISNEKNSYGFKYELMGAMGIP